MNLVEISWTYGDRFELDRVIQKLVAIENRDQFIYIKNDRSSKLKSEELVAIIESRGDYWHGGVAINFDFKLNKYIQPCWMLDIVPQIDEDFISWKMNGASAIIPLWLFDQVGYPSTHFSSIESAFMDWSFRAIKSGAIPVNSRLLRGTFQEISRSISLSDELRFNKRNYSRFWTTWATVRAVINRQLSIFQVWKANRELDKFGFVPCSKIDRKKVECYQSDASISVVIITLDRYNYLSATVGLLINQTTKPLEIIVVDATPDARRSTDWLDQFQKTDIPIRLHFSEIGQCTQRNKGIELAKGDYIYFCDDDMDEMRPDHLLRHMCNIKAFRADASCGMPDEVGAFITNRESFPLQISSVFPTNDSLVCKELLVKVGGFDIKMDRGQSEDQELGLRLFRSGALILLDPQIRDLHLRASSGGLRNSNVRKITRASSRSKVLHFRLPHLTEIYLNMKHFGHWRVRELNIILLAATLVLNPSSWRILVKFLVGICLLPYHYFIIKSRNRSARMMLSK